MSYDLTISPEILIIGNTYFNFTGVKFYFRKKKKDFGKILINNLNIFLTVDVALERT